MILDSACNSFYFEQQLELIEFSFKGHSELYKTQVSTLLVAWKKKRRLKVIIVINTFVN